MSKFAFFVLFAAALISVAPVASAGVLFQFIDLDNQEDILTDDSMAEYAGPGSAFAPAIGGTIYGFLQITTTDETTSPPPVVIGIFSATITAEPSPGSYTLSPTPAGPLSLASLAPSLTGAALANGATAADLASSIFVVGSSMASTNYFEIAKTSLAAPTAQLGTIDAALGYDLLAGFTGAPDFFTATTIVTPGFGVTGFSELGLFSVLNSTLPGADPFNPVRIPGFPVGPMSDIGLTSTVGGFVGSAVGTWDYTDQATLSINPVPEPMSIVVWAAIASVAGLGWRYRRSA